MNLGNIMSKSMSQEIWLKVSQYFSSTHIKSLQKLIVIATLHDNKTKNKPITWPILLNINSRIMTPSFVGIGNKGNIFLQT